MGHPEEFSAIEDASLEGMDLFSAGELRRFAEYNIRTVAELLGASKGLTARESLRLMGIGEASVEAAVRALPAALLARYAVEREQPPMGLWTGEDGDEA